MMECFWIIFIIFMVLGAVRLLPILMVIGGIVSAFSGNMILGLILLVIGLMMLN